MIRLLLILFTVNTVFSVSEGKIQAWKEQVNNMPNVIKAQNKKDAAYQALRKLLDEHAACRTQDLNALQSLNRRLSEARTALHNAYSVLRKAREVAYENLAKKDPEFAQHIADRRAKFKTLLKRHGIQ